jgi:hypothetical protein
MLHKMSQVVIVSVLCKYGVLSTDVSHERNFCVYRPTFMFLKGQTIVDQVKGADKGYVLYIYVSTPI